MWHGEPRAPARIPYKMAEAELWSAKAALAAAKAENEMLLRQLTRLCVFIEQTTGRDPIEIMHTEDYNPTEDATAKSSVAVAAVVAAGKAASSAGRRAGAAVPTPVAEPEAAEDESFYSGSAGGSLGRTRRWRRRCRARHRQRR